MLRPGGRRAARVVGSTTGGKSWGVISPSDVSLVLWFPGVLPQLDRSTRELELGLDYGTPTMNLAGQSLKFENGQWVADSVISGGVDRRETQRLRKRNQQLEEENNLLRLKVDILLDMLSETTAESHLKDKELDELKVTNRRRK